MDPILTIVCILVTFGVIAYLIIRFGRAVSMSHDPRRDYGVEPSAKTDLDDTKSVSPQDLDDTWPPAA